MVLSRKMNDILAGKIAKWSFRKDGSFWFAEWLTPVEIYYMIQQGIREESMTHTAGEMKKRMKVGNCSPIFVGFKLDRFLKENQYNVLGILIKHKMRNYEK